MQLSSQLTAHSSQARRGVGSSLLIAAVLVITMPALAQQSANPDDARRAVAGHEFTTTAGSATTLDERLSDIKTPGDLLASDGRSYVVGTVDVTTTSGSPTFSGAIVLRPTPSWGVTTSYTQVGIVQCREADQTIAWQRYFYGWSGSASRWTNLRAVAVWPAAVEADVRVVICGETTDLDLPLGTTLSSATTTDPTGFISVLDGAGQILWTQRFYGHNFSERCAITDVAIRVEYEGSSVYDVVTYCGVSTHGNPGGGTPLSPLLPFQTSIGVYGYTPADGDTNAGQGFWDGIVGRVRFERSTSTISRDFHSILGGSESDGLFGISLLDADRFVVVGNTCRNSSTASAEAFPFTAAGLDDTGSTNSDWNNNLSTAPAYCVGTITTFDATGTRSSQPLDLLHSAAMGRIGQFQSTARDVWAAPYGEGFSVFVVGATDDSNANGDFITSLTGSSRGAQPAIGGGQDGFLVNVDVDTSFSVGFAHASFLGDSGRNGLTGVSGWNETPHNCAVAGYTDNSGSGQGYDLTVASTWAITQNLVRADVVGSSLNDVPAALGTSHAMTGAHIYPTVGSPGLGEPSGGGVAVDSRMRVSIVGTSPSAQAGTNFPVVAGSAPLGGLDGVRVVYDMLPNGIWRTDGTGTRATAFGAVPQPVSFFGGTTPVGCLGQFGHLPGEAEPELLRMAIDYEGPAPAGGVSTASIAISNFRPSASTYVIGFLQFGAPSSTPVPVNGAQVEIWLSSPAVLFAGTSTATSFNWSLPTMPSPGSFEFTVQGVFLLPSGTTLTCDPTANPGTIASPALVISY